MKILFVGESWLGSCARSMKEALSRQPEVVLDEVNEDFYFPKHRAKWLRGVHKLLGFHYRRELAGQIVRRIEDFQPDVVVTYKGHSIQAPLLRVLQRRGIRTVNVYPDCSPHAHGEAHRQSVGAYDLVISTKPFHSRLWAETYGYHNPCKFVPQGYDPALHLARTPPASQTVDVAMVATWRAEYHQLMLGFAAALGQHAVSVAIAGDGWLPRRSEFPSHWRFAGALEARSYVEWLRNGRICIAPLTRDVLVDGVVHPGDEDTTRTYELAAAHCFFIHRRTSYVQKLYDESSEVPFFDSPEELAAKTLKYLALPAERALMARAAHERAVPAYSLDARAAAIVEIMSNHV